MSLIFLLISSTIIIGQDSETRSLDSFDGITVSESINAEIIKGNKNSIKITAYEVDLEDVETDIDSGNLKVGMKSKNWNGSWSKRRKVDVVITYTDDPEYINVNSSADLIAKDVIKSDKLELKVSSSGDLILEVDVNNLKAQVSSSGDIDIKGKANTADVSVSSSGDFTGKKLMVQDADLSASSSADISIHVDGNLTARASSSADIDYYGNPKNKKISKSSQGSVSGN